MILRKTWTRLVPAAMFPLLLITDASATDQSDLPAVFTFAAGYRINTSSPHNFVEYGVIRRCRETWCMSVQRFDSEKLLPRVPTSYSHKMRAPYGGATCSNDRVSRVGLAIVEEQAAKLTREGDGILVEAKDRRYYWKLDAEMSGGYVLSEMAFPKEENKLDQVVGFAFPSAHELGKYIKFAQLASKYKGEIYKKTAFTGVRGDWDLKSSIMDFRRYHEDESGSILYLTEPGLPAVVEKYGGPMWVNHSILLSREGNSIAPLVHEYGHDFNRDGCFNESGHNKLMLPVRSDGDSDSVRALVYIEYTSDYQRGFPMLSVGRYYR